MKTTQKLSKRNQRGLWVLTVLIICASLSPRVINYFFPSDEWTISEVEMEKEIASMDETILKTNKTWNKKASKFRKPNRSFDPNSYSANDWTKLGVSQKQADVIVKFTKRGIYSNDELKQIFVLPEELFTLIKDSTFYPERASNYVKFEKKEYPSTAKKANVIIELNTATELELVDLNGVGPYFAQKILEYREKLGGFHSKNQLLEVWKLDAEKLAAFENQITVDPESIKKININTATVEELKAHPYISWNIANSIVKIRTKKQKFNSINEIKESVLIDKELFDKLKIYLTI